MLCPEPPYPLHGGGAMRTAAMAHYLSKRYLLDLILFREAQLPPPELPPGLVDQLHIIPIPTHRRDPASRALRNLRRALYHAPPLIDRFTGFGAALERLVRNRQWDVAVVEHEWCAGYHQILRGRAAKLIIDLHNIESAWHESVAASSSWPLAAIHRRFALGAYAVETEWLPCYDLALTCSEDDRERVPQAAAEVWPNTIPRREIARLAQKNQIVFSGNFDYEPNRAAFDWFARNVWPALSKQAPGLRWLLLGRGSDRLPIPAGAVATGAIEDALPELAASRAAVVPLLSGSGTRIKILEAWSAGVPVVSTSIGAEGLPTDALRIADDPTSFANAVAELVTSPQEAERLAALGTRTFNTTFTWESGWKVLEQLAV